MTLREKELVVAAGNPGAAVVVANLALQLGYGTTGYDHSLDRMIEEGMTGATCYLRSIPAANDPSRHIPRPGWDGEKIVAEGPLLT